MPAKKTSNLARRHDPFAVAIDRHHISGMQLTAPPIFGLTIYFHVPTRQYLFGVAPRLGDIYNFQQLTQQNQIATNRDGSRFHFRNYVNFFRGPSPQKSGSPNFMIGWP